MAMTTTISAGELRERLATSGADLKILDVRTPAEFGTSHIPGAANVPLDDLPKVLDELSTLSHEIVVVCQSGTRAAKACGTLQHAGLTSVKVLDGGMASWEKVGGAVDKGKARWALERQVRLVAGLIVLTAVVLSIWFPWTKWIAAAIGFGLTFAAVSNTCAMGAMLMKLPYNKGEGVDLDESLAQLGAGETS